MDLYLPTWLAIWLADQSVGWVSMDGWMDGWMGRILSGYLGEWALGLVHKFQKIHVCSSHDLSHSSGSLLTFIHWLIAKAE